MTIYQALQLNAKGSKDLIRSCTEPSEKRKWSFVYLLKIGLTVAFCFFFVTAFSLVFGGENSIAGVAVLLILLLVRQADFGIDTKSSLLALFFLFILLAFGPKLANSVPAFAAFLIHACCIFAITMLGCHNIIMCNHFTFVLSYLLLYGYDVSGPAYKTRLAALLTGFLMCAAVFCKSHRHRTFKRSFRHLFDELDFHSSRTQWQIRISLATASAMFLASLFHLPRVMWIGIACMSIMTPLIKDSTYRELRRAPFNIVGCLLFLLLYNYLPEGIVPYIGILGGIGVGFSAGYSFQNIFNALGALMAATPLLGLTGAVFFRILANAAATLYCILFNAVWEWVRRLFGKEEIISC